MSRSKEFQGKISEIQSFHTIFMGERDLISAPLHLDELCSRQTHFEALPALAPAWLRLCFYWIHSHS